MSPRAYVTALLEKHSTEIPDGNVAVVAVDEDGGDDGGGGRDGGDDNPSTAVEEYVSEQIESRIFGDSVVSSDEFEYLVSMQDFGYYCGGSLITPDVMLTSSGASASGSIPTQSE